MEYITIKNFGPITNIENLAVQDMMVFIGPQATGKSTIAKLLWFFRSPNIYTTESLKQPFLNIFPKSLLYKDTYLSFSYQNGAEITIEGTEVIISWKNKNILGNRENELSDYIPASRASVGAIHNSIKSFISGAFYGLAASGKMEDFMDKFTILYLQRLEYDKNMFLNSFTSATTPFDMGVFVARFFQENPSKARIFNHLANIILNGGSIYVDKESKEFIKIKNRLIPLHFASTGQQETYGLLIHILHVLFFQDMNLIDAEGEKSENLTYDLLYVEEPESHLFPLAQKAIVELLTLFLNNKEGNQLVLTTHSPYILTSINNLLFAHKVATQNPEIADKVADLVDREKWIDGEKIGVYYVNNGGIESIIDEETGLIGEQALDTASEEIGEEFDKILDIRRQYRKQKA